MNSSKMTSGRESRALPWPSGATNRSRREGSFGLVSSTSDISWRPLWGIRAYDQRVGGTLVRGGATRSCNGSFQCAPPYHDRAVGYSAKSARNRFQILDPCRDIRQILCHELAHAAVVMKCGRAACSHGTEWRHFVRVAGFEPETHLVSHQAGRATSKVSRAPPVYEHRCVICQAVRLARKPVPNWRCVECVGAGLEGALEIRMAPRARVAR